MTIQVKQNRFFLLVSAIGSILFWIGVFTLLLGNLSGCMTLKKAERKYATNVVDTTFTTITTVIPRDSAVTVVKTDTTYLKQIIRQGRATVTIIREPTNTTVIANCDSLSQSKRFPVQTVKQIWGVSPNYKTATHVLIGLVIALILVYFFTRKWAIVPRT